MKTPEFLEINPLGLLPAIKDGDFCLTESAAILRYLCDSREVEDSLYPRKDHRARAKIGSFLDYNGQIVRPMLLDHYLWAVFIGPVLLKREPPSEERVKEIYDTKLNPVFEYLETVLSKSPFLAGENLSIADLQVYETFNTNVAMGGMEFSSFEALRHLIL